MKHDLNQIITKLKKGDKISISYLQQALSISFIKANEIFNELIGKGYINNDGLLLLDKDNSCSLEEEKVIFLGVDGVLNSHSTKERCLDLVGIEDKKVALLKEIVDVTKANIVLISSRKTNWTNNPLFKDNQDEVASYLDEKLAKQGLLIKDKTIEGSPLYRGKGILRYIKMQKEAGIDVEKFVILDDEMFDYLETKLTKYLIQTSYEQNGLEKKHVRKAIEKLS